MKRCKSRGCRFLMTPGSRALTCGCSLFFLLTALFPVQLLANGGGDEYVEMPPLELKKSFFGGTKFSYEGGRKQKIFGFGGMSFTDEFTQVMSKHPPALRMAKKSHLYNGISQIGMLVFLVDSVKSLYDALSDTEEINTGNMPDTGLEVSDLVVPAVAGLVAIIPGILASRYLQDGIRIYNERELNTGLLPGGAVASLDRGMYIDLLLGFNNLKVQAEGGPGDSGQGGHMLGFLIDNRGAGRSGMQSGLLMSTKKSEGFDLTYLKFPVHWKYTMETKRVHPYIFVGPSLNFLLSSKSSDTGAIYDEDDFFFLDLAMNAGMGLRLEKYPVSFAAMLSKGFVSIFDEEYNNMPDIKLDTFYFYASYSF